MFSVLLLYHLGLHTLKSSKCLVRWSVAQFSVQILMQISWLLICRSEVSTSPRVRCGYSTPCNRDAVEASHWLHGRAALWGYTLQKRMLDKEKKKWLPYKYPWSLQIYVLWSEQSVFSVKLQCYFAQTSSSFQFGALPESSFTRTTGSNESGSSEFVLFHSGFPRALLD